MAVALKNIFAGTGDASGAAAATARVLHGDFSGARRILADQSARSDARNAKEAADLNDIWDTPAVKAAITIARSGGQPNGADVDTTYRNHNPGNLRPYKAGQATDARGFRVFGSDLEGRSALSSDIDASLRKLDTIAKIISKYAPSSENDTGAYIAAVSKALGKGANEHLTHDDNGRS